MKMYFSPVFWSLVEVERVIILKSLRSSFAEKVKVQQLSVVSSLQNPTKMSLLQLLVFCGLVFSSGFFFFFFSLLQELNVSQKKRNPLVTLSLSQKILHTVH